MNHDYSKRDYLLPEGCKDLSDVWKLAAQKKAQEQRASMSPAALPPIIGELATPEGTSVAELASLLNQKPFQIIADLMEAGVFANINHKLDFDTIAKVARKYGYMARRAG